MAWSELRIKSWAEFDAEVLEKHLQATRPLRYTYVYRGQSDSAWGLEPSLTRLCLSLGLDRTRATEVEAAVLKRFQQRAHLYLPPHLIPEVGLLDWWTLMQHYRAPTRILDWSHSPLVALYFAVNERWDADGVVWLFQRYYLSQGSIEKYGEIPEMGPVLDDEEWFRLAEPPPRIVPFDRVRLTERMVAQQGTFTVAQDVLLNHASGLEAVLPEPAQMRPGTIELHRGKVVVPRALKKDLLRRLHQMNITADALFPGVDGLGAELEEVIRLL
ncbi:MAG: hypothetical protein JWO68_4047 [Actinomycetia bacterium]|nr:hypothetical protein [Actinomycetes bacterium]